jgi:fido (protein-threonine AMPylation protein)
MSHKSFNQRQKKILSSFIAGKAYALKDVNMFFSDSESPPSLATLKRDLSSLCEMGYLNLSGYKKSSSYTLSETGIVLCPIDPKEYCDIEIDKRNGNASYNFDLFKNLPSSLFSDDELKQLKYATEKYKSASEGVSEVLRKKELERFIIELSWKSSKIEGNTYSLLDTERLLREGIQAEGHTKEEATMIINHKNAFQYILNDLGGYKVLSVNKIDEIHSILIHQLGVPGGIRNRLVRITGSLYAPLNVRIQIEEALNMLLQRISEMTDPYSKALIALTGIAYIQPFEDGNKRTSRLTANAVLLANELAPLSYRSIDEVSYKEAMLVFYERNSILAIREIFIEQYFFACKNYLVKG